MRSTIFISALFIGALTLAGSAGAQEFGGECYARDYSAEHLAKFPAQGVASVRVDFGQMGGAVEGEIGVAGLRAVMADTALTRQEGSAGETFSAFLICRKKPAEWDMGDWVSDGSVICSAECDGGFFMVERISADELVIRTEGVALEGEGEGCGGRAMLADFAPGDPTRHVLTRFRLTRAPAEVCAQ
ncbi:hypothetical protein [Vannielia litorea]|uniref:Uncharacterized protein n=1 Tax=Vannielia litorea TaxID=1217970 RepID=A0A1N6ERD1_9RHOB|nr:hypothetical protein [Vannielia litorea]SIN85575.1 hypothetical protein SAMN05444002_1030 [Vannielia litorea]